LELVQACVTEGIAVDAIPGASAPLALAVLSGFQFCPWTLFGFPPRGKRPKTWLAQVSSIQHAVTFLEAPHRITRTLQELTSCSGDRPIVVGRELTKMHQTLYRGTVSVILSREIEVRGEFTVMLGPSSSNRKLVATRAQRRPTGH
jgi:16S rRNA (cytidine1402-2'-O)-methyltransferase